MMKVQIQSVRDGMPGWFDVSRPGWSMWSTSEMSDSPGDRARLGVGV